MKKLLFPVLFLVLAAVVSCDNDDDKGVAVNATVKSYIETKYPGASIRKAEYENNGLLEVEFIHDSKLKDAYFKPNNEWVYTEWDIALSALPKSVADAVAEAYPSHRIDDVDYVETLSGNYYEVEIEKGGAELWLYVTADGTILEGGIEGTGTLLDNSVTAFIETEYPGAAIRKSEYDENGLYEVEIVHQNVVKEVYFNASAEWVYSEWDVAVPALPVQVRSGAAELYPDYRIDDADFVETPSLQFYKLNLERGNFEQDIFLAPDGSVIDF